MDEVYTVIAESQVKIDAFLDEIQELWVLMSDEDLVGEGLDMAWDHLVSCMDAMFSLQDVLADAIDLVCLWHSD